MFLSFYDMKLLSSKDENVFNQQLMLILKSHLRVKLRAKLFNIYIKCVFFHFKTELIEKISSLSWFKQRKYITINTHWPLYLVHLSNCSLMQISIQQIKWQQFSAFRHDQDDLLQFNPSIRMEKKGH